MANAKKNIFIIAIVLAVCCGITFAVPVVLGLVSSVGMRFILNCAVYVVLGACGVVGMKCSGMELKPLFSFKNVWQYALAVAIAGVLSLSIAVLPVVCGGNLAGPHMDPTKEILIKNAIFLILFVGPVEELVFRAYLQEVLVGVMPKHKWVGVILASCLFGAWHLFNGGAVNALFATVIGLVIGFAKYRLKNCTYISVALGHGLYDFSLVLVRAFLV